MRNRKFIYFFGALGGLLFGYDTGIISGSLHFLVEDLHIVENSLDEGFVTASVLIGAACGAILIGKISDTVGRKPALLISSVIFVLGALFSGFAPSATILILARIVLGIGVGSASALVPMYLSELAPSARRGSLAFLNQLMIVIGILLSYIVNYSFVVFGSVQWNTEFGWRVALGVACFPAAVMFAASFFLPESPRFLVRTGDVNAARDVLARIRPASHIDAEISQIKAALTTKSGTLKEVFSKFARPALVIGAGLAIFQQLIGINTVIYYAPKILATEGLSLDNQRLVTVGIGAMNLVATLVAIAIVDKVDRRVLLTAGSVVMFLSLSGLAASSASGLGSWIQTVPSILILIYIVAFGVTWGGAMWILLGEIFPLHIRGVGVGIASMLSWVANFGVSLLFPFLLGHPAEVEEWGESVPATMLSGNPAWLFAGMAVFCLISLVFVRLVVFETRGKSLEEIESDLQERALKKR